MSSNGVLAILVSKHKAYLYAEWACRTLRRSSRLVSIRR
jgi:hypothetical protein